MTEATAIRNVVIGTAGHIDHGKSTLVKRLTGIDPDRWQEEKDKGITIDLGFANFLYRDQFRVGMIDVPGHERFVKNMVAGASGVDIVMLVVAADDGVMPQTREHLEILTLLGVKRGLVAITKIDTVDADTVELAKEDISDLVKGTFLQGARMVPLSSITGQGIEELWEAIGEVIEATEPRDTQGVFRMPIQRVFSAKGQGAVLTGVPLSGHAKVGDTLVVLPGDQKAKVRSIQAYHSAIEEARAGHSSAFNMTGVDHSKVERGHTLCAPGVFEPSRFFSLTLRLLASAPRPLKHRAEVKFHVGTSELVAHLQLLDRTLLNPGETCVCEIMLEDPVVAGIGDHFIIRQPSPAVTLGGGRIVRRESAKLPRNDDALLETLTAWAEAADDPARRVELAALDAGPGGINRERMIPATELTRESVNEIAGRLIAENVLSEFGPGKALVHREAWPRAQARLVEILSRHHDAHPAQLGMKIPSVQQQLGVDARTFAPIMEKGAGGRHRREARRTAGPAGPRWQAQRRGKENRRARGRAARAGAAQPPHLERARAGGRHQPRRHPERRGLPGRQRARRRAGRRRAVQHQGAGLGERGSRQVPERQGRGGRQGLQGSDPHQPQVPDPAAGVARPAGRNQKRQRHPHTEVGPEQRGNRERPLRTAKIRNLAALCGASRFQSMALRSRACSPPVAPCY
ncbi:MAG: selenocysteine-specific translation elongation factor [Planctomycetota bacterium]|nr:selenocysteine-specific translation elongation factor [Planctomycetota bacterium]